MPVMYHH